MLLIPAFQRQGQDDLIVRSSIARATQRNPASKNKTKLLQDFFLPPCFQEGARLQMSLTGAKPSVLGTYPLAQLHLIS